MGKRREKYPFHLVLEAPNGTAVMKTPVYLMPPLDDTDTDKLIERGEAVTELVEEGMISYMAFLLKVKKKCNCFAKDKSWLDPTKHMHSSECPVMYMRT